jgi:hypothetical protein
VASAAHAARVFKPFDGKLHGYSPKLREASLKGWAYLEKTPDMTPADGKDGAGQTASAPGDCSALNDGYLRTYAAAELYKTTGDEKFRKYFDAHYKTRVGQGAHPILDGWVDPLNANEITRATSSARSSAIRSRTISSPSERRPRTPTTRGCSKGTTAGAPTA